MQPKQEVAPQPAPAAPPDPDRGMEFAGREIDQAIVGAEPNRQVRMRDLERPQPRCQPGGGEGLGGADRQQARIVGEQPGKGVVERVEGRADQWRDSPARIGQ